MALGVAMEGGLSSQAAALQLWLEEPGCFLKAKRLWLGKARGRQQGGHGGVRTVMASGQRGMAMAAK